MRAAVTGCGDVSVVHLGALARLEGVDVVAVCDVEADRAERAAPEGAAVFTDHERMLEAVRPDVVHVCTPHDSHAALAIAALDRGVHVLLEKPLAHDRAEGERLVRAAEGAAVRLGVCLQNRYNAPVRAARELLADGALGLLLGAHATVAWHRGADYYAARPWRGTWAGSGGGLLMNQAIHTLDLVQWLLGPVVEVGGGIAARSLADAIEVEDTADLVLRHDNGVVSTVFASLANSTNLPVSVDLVGERASLRIGRGLSIDHADGRHEFVPDEAVQREGRAYWGASHELLIGDFYDALASGRRFAIDARAASASLEIVQRLYDVAVPGRGTAR